MIDKTLLQEARDALATEREYVHRAILEHDSKYARHPATELDRAVLTHDLESLAELLTRLDAELAKVGTQCPCGCSHVGEDECFDPDCPMYDELGCGSTAKVAEPVDEEREIVVLRSVIGSRKDMGMTSDAIARAVWQAGYRLPCQPVVLDLSNVWQVEGRYSSTSLLAAIRAQLPGVEVRV